MPYRMFFRVDTRLIHGQIVEAWLPFLGARHVIVANDILVQDALRQQIMCLAIPHRVQIHFLSLTDLPQILRKYASEKCMVLFENIGDLHAFMPFYTAQQVQASMPAIELNVGNLHYGKEKKELFPHVYVSDAEWHMLRELAKKFPLDFRSIPSEKARTLNDVLS